MKNNENEKKILSEEEQMRIKLLQLDAYKFKYAEKEKVLKDMEVVMQTKNQMIRALEEKIRTLDMDLKNLMSKS